MSVMRKIKFERFSPEEPEEDPVYEEPVNVTTTDINVGVSSSSFQNLNSNKSLLEWVTPVRVIAATIAFLLVQFVFVILVSYFVQCDEGKLISYFEERKTSIENAYSNISELWEKDDQEMEEAYKSQIVKWITFKQYDIKILKNLAPGGSERLGTQNVLLYVARAKYLSGTVAGKYCPHLRTMYFGYLGRELTKSDFEILSYPRGALSWIPANSGNIPQEELLVSAGGAPLSGESTFICRAVLDNHLIIGKYLSSKNNCIVAYKNREYPQNTFEILAVNGMGKLMGVDS